MPDEHPCKTKGNCGVTVAPSATHVISLHIEDDISNASDEKAFTKPFNSKYISENGYYYLKSETQKAVNAILHKIDSSGRIFPRFEKKVCKRLDALEQGIERVLESVKISKLKSPEEKSKVIPELVATETWSYIDSKFTELKSKLIAANEKIKSDFEERINEVLNTYDQRGWLLGIEEDNILINDRHHYEQLTDRVTISYTFQLHRRTSIETSLVRQRNR